MGAGHDHGQHTHGHGSPAPGARKALAGALALTFGFMFVELAVGLWSGSLALLADAGHMFNDAAALTLSLVVTWLASGQRTRKHTYGYRRAEVVGATVNALALVGAGGFIAYEAVQRFATQPEIHGEGMLGTATLGLVVNLVVARILWSASSGSINVRAAMFHVMGDALGSVAAIVAGVLVWAFDWRLADPIASLIIAVLILIGATTLLRSALRVLMEGVPSGVDVSTLEATIVATDGVSAVHDLHVWALVPEVPILSAHVVLSNGSDACEVVRVVGDRLAEAHGITHTTIQPETHVHHAPLCDGDENHPCDDTSAGEAHA